MAANCALCEILGQSPRPSENTITVHTILPGLIARSTDRRDVDAPEQQVTVPVCPEHVVDVYRGRLAGVRMAWGPAPVVRSLAGRTR